MTKNPIKKNKTKKKQIVIGDHIPLYPSSQTILFMPYYGLFWMQSTYLDLQWRSRSTGTIPEILITSIVWHTNKNRWVGDPLWRSCSLFCVVIFHSSFGLMKYPYTKQFTWSPHGIPPSPVLVIKPIVPTSPYLHLYPTVVCITQISGWYTLRNNLWCITLARNYFLSWPILIKIP